MATTPARLEFAAHGWDVDHSTSGAHGAGAAVTAPPAGINRKRIAIVSVFTAVTAAAAGLGYMPWEVPAILVLWVAGLWAAATAAHRSDLKGALNVDTASYSFNAVLLTLVCYNLGGSTWLAGTFYTLLVLVAAAGLPLRRAVVVAVIAWLGFATLALGPVLGFLTPPAFGITDPPRADVSFAVITVVFQALALGSVVVLQQWLVGALRSTAHASRALMEASTDIVVALNRTGEIQGSHAGFSPASRTGSAPKVSLDDIVTDSHRGYLQLKLAEAFSGKRVAFEVAYKGDDGGERWLGGTLVPLVVGDADPRVLLIGRDMTLEHAMTEESVASLAREAAGHRTKTLEKTVIESMQKMDASLHRIHDRASVLRARKQIQEDADHADAIAQEAERLRASARELLGWVKTFSGDASRSRQGGRERGPG